MQITWGPCWETGLPFHPSSAFSSPALGSDIEVLSKKNANTEISSSSPLKQRIDHPKNWRVRETGQGGDPLSSFHTRLKRLLGAGLTLVGMLDSSAKYIVTLGCFLFPMAKF